MNEEQKTVLKPSDVKSIAEELVDFFIRCGEPPATMLPTELILIGFYAGASVVHCSVAKQGNIQDAAEVLAKYEAELIQFAEDQLKQCKEEQEKKS